MKIRILGFEWFWGESGVSLSDFYDRLQKLSAAQIAKLEKGLADADTAEPLEKVIALSKRDGHWIGVLIKIKDIRSFCKLKKTGESFTLTSQLLEDDDKMVDVNFFVINESTGKGLYQHYHQSSWINSFSHFCKLEYDKETSARKKALEEQAAAENWTKKKLKAALRELKGLRYEIIPKPGSFPQFVRQMERIKKISFEFNTYEPTYKPMQALSRYSKRDSHSFSFSKTIDMKSLKDDFLKHVSEGAYKRARVEGMDPGEMEVVYNLTRNYDYFGEYEYDEIISEAELDFENILDSLEKSPMIERLLKLANKPAVKRILEAPK